VQPDRGRVAAALAQALAACRAGATTGEIAAFVEAAMVALTVDDARGHEGRDA
jgi:Xaa-Pro aminopeptidase